MTSFSNATNASVRDQGAPKSSRGLWSSVGDVFGWFAGAHLGALRESSTDRPFYSALGACAFFFSLLSAFMVMSAVAYVTRTPDPWTLWWVVPLWLAVMSSLERLILQVSGDRVIALVIAAIPRLAVSVLVAMAVGEMFALKAFEPEINDVIAEQKLQKLETVGPTLDRIYAEKAVEAKSDIARLLRNERKVEERIAREELRAQQALVEEGSCALHCKYYMRLAADDRRQLEWMRERNRGRIADRRVELRSLNGNRQVDSRERRTTINQQDGLLARKAALQKLQASNGAINFDVWLLRLLLIALDLVAFTAKVARCLTVKDSAYDKNVAGRRAEEGLLGEQRLENSRTEQARIRDEGRAARRRHKWRAEEQEFTRFDAAGAAFAASDADKPIAGYSLTEFTENMDDWERRPVVVPPALRRGGFVGLALLVLTTVIVLLLDAQGVIVGLVAAAAALLLCLATQGFQTAPAWALRAIFATFLGGLSLPLLLLLLTL